VAEAIGNHIDRHSGEQQDRREDVAETEAHTLPKIFFVGRQILLLGADNYALKLRTSLTGCRGSSV
jgi:hypothetical protein